MILIIGAAGLNGTAIVNEFMKHKEPVKVLIQDPKEAAKFDNSLVEVFVGDMLKPETLGNALKGVDKAVLISSADPERMMVTQESFIDAAKAAGVHHIVKLSCLNAAAHSPARFIRMHDEIEKYLESSGIGWTHIRPTHFMQMYLLNAPTIAGQNTFYYPMGDKKVAPIDVHDIAKVFYETLTAEGHENKAYELSGPETLTMHDIALRLSKALGRTIQYVDVSPEEYRKQMIAFGASEALADAINELYSERRKGTESKVLLETHRLFNVRPTTFAEFIGQNIDALEVPKMN